VGWLWAIVVIILFFALLFLLPISLRIGFSGEATLDVGLPGIYFPILPKKPRKYKLRDYSLRKHRKRLKRDLLAKEKKKQKEWEKAQKKMAASQSKSQEKAKKLPPEAPSDEPSPVRVILPLVGGVLDTFAGKLRVRLLQLEIRIGGSDAAQIALMHGAISQGMAYLLALISQKTRYSQSGKTRISVTPDFLLSKTEANVKIIFRLRLIDLVSTALVFLVRFLKRKAELSSPVKPNPVNREVQT